MDTNSISEHGVPKWEFLNLPAPFHMGSPHKEIGTLGLGNYWVMQRRHAANFFC